MCRYLLDNLIGIIGILTAGFIAYHVYFLSERIKLRDKLSNRDRLKKDIDKLISRNTDEHTQEVELINVKKYEKFYPDNNDENKDGYTYLKAAVKNVCYDGVEFFTGLPIEAYKNSNGDLSLEQKTKEQKEVLLLHPVGLIPYEWIEYIDMQGDEYSWRPQFFVKFKGVKKFPYKYVRYYKKSETYCKGSDPVDWQWAEVNIAEK